MSKEFPTIGHRQRLDDALRLLQEKAAPAVAIVDAGGRLVGLVTLRNHWRDDDAAPGDAQRRDFGALGAGAADLTGSTGIRCFFVRDDYVARKRRPRDPG